MKCWLTIVFCLLAAGSKFAWAQKPPLAPQKVILDTDIGDDIDDAYALALVLTSPELKLLGVTTAWGDTGLRAQLVEGLLCKTGRQNIPVFIGVATKAHNVFTQASWASRFPPPRQTDTDAIAWMAKTIRANPGQITLIEIAPLSNVGALIDRDPAAFRMLKRVVMMGGSIHRGYGDLGYAPDRGPSAEYNIAMDVSAAKKLFASGVPITMAPLDSTQMKLDEVMRSILFRHSTPLTDSLEVLTHEWGGGSSTPTLFDVMAVEATIDGDLCPTQPMRIRIDDAGFTRPEAGAPNVDVCLHSDSDRFFQFLLPRLMQQRLGMGSSNPGCSALAEKK
ncbi:MAG TPA: nucleoside hydrolase [Acidobacteriaceae bacterium]|nr:nucleoside hydrolase [Acidobacteriaceae bacterium]